jgi:putative ABC transport system ATP-binding protein
MTVLDNVALPLTYKGRLSTRRLKIAHEMLERVGLADREYFYPHQLSGGQIQRAAIARALINDPTIIIADEPTGNLDSISSRMVMELLSDIHDMGNTVLMVTHNPELTRYASRVLYMYDGAIQHDVQKQVGVAATSRQTKLFAPEGSVEDDLQSVAAKMALEAEKESTKPQAAKTKRSKRSAKSKRKVKS